MDQTGRENIDEATRLWEQYQQQYTPGRQTLPSRPEPHWAIAALEGAFQGAMEGLGNLGHAATIPARAIAGAATPMLPGRRPYSTVDYAIYGVDPETGGGAETAGTLLANSLVEQGELAPDGKARDIVEFVGNMLTDPMIAPAVLSGAEAAGALGARSAPAAMVRRAPRSAPSMRAGSGPLPNPTATQPVQIVRPPVGARSAPAARSFPEYRSVGGRPAPGATDTQAIRPIKPQGTSMEARFAAKRAEMRNAPRRVPSSKARKSRKGGIERQAKKRGMTREGGKPAEGRMEKKARKSGMTKKGGEE